MNQSQKDHLNVLSRELRDAQRIKNQTTRQALVTKIAGERAALLAQMAGRGPLTRAFERITSAVDREVANLSPADRLEVVRNGLEYLLRSSTDAYEAVLAVEAEAEKAANLEPAA